MLPNKFLRLGAGHDECQGGMLNRGSLLLLLLLPPDLQDCLFHPPMPLLCMLA